MKILKKAKQHNVIINKDYYTEYELNYMCLQKEIFFFDKDLIENYNYDDIGYYERQDIELRIFTENLKEIKVVLDEYGMYTTVAIGNNGKLYYIKLD